MKTVLLIFVSILIFGILLGFFSAGSAGLVFFVIGLLGIVISPIIFGITRLVKGVLPETPAKPEKDPTKSDTYVDPDMNFD